LFELLFKYPPADYARSELVYLGDWPAWLLSLLLVATLAAIAGVLLTRRARTRWYRLAAIGVLQAVVAAVIVWALRLPSLATERLRDGENTVALVLDASASMAIGEPQSRFRQALENLASVPGSEAPDLSLRYYELGAGPRAVDSFAATTPTAEASAIGATLAAILEQARYRPLAAVVLASDGADTGGGLGSAALADLAAWGIPVHTIGTGSASMPDDLELEDVTLPVRALPGSTVPARITVRHDAAGSALVKVYDGDELLDVVPVELAADRSSTTAWVEVNLAEPGPHELSFSVDGGAGEADHRNNARSALVNVAADRYRILYFEGEPRWEYKFMRRAIEHDEDLVFATLLRVSPNKFYRQGIDTPEQLADGFPTDRDELFGYDALILGSVEAALLDQAQQQLVRDFVSERGGSLLMLAGPSGLGNGGWGQSAIADVLPVVLPPSSVDTFHRKKARAILTPQGAASRMLRFAAGEEENRDAWQELPEVADYQLTGNLKPAAVRLLDADTDSGRVPLLVGQAYGKGHAWVLATGGTWRWQMSMPLEDTKHETFWRQVLRALVATAPDNVSLEAVRTGAGNQVALRAEFRDDAFNPLDAVSVSVVASDASGEAVTVAMRPGEEPGVYTGNFEPTGAGTWYFEAIAAKDGAPLAAGRTSILQESAHAEDFGIRANPALLRRISEATGGRYFEAGDLGGLADLLRYSSAGITETEYRSIWDAPAVLLLLFLLKGGEWLLRRRWKSI